MNRIPELLPNVIGGVDRPAAAGETLEKVDPVTGATQARLARSRGVDARAAVSAARGAQRAWGEVPAVQRGLLLHRLVVKMEAEQETLAAVVARETGKSLRDARGEVGAAIQLGLFWASEAQRLYGRTTGSGVAHRTAATIRQPVGVAALIVAANTPIANVSWKVFPALACGNAAVLKAAEDTPATAWLFVELARQAGLPPGVLNLVQGLGVEAGAPLVADPEVDLVSFTGSTAVGREIAAVAGRRLAKVSLELGGKNCLVVCDDADLDDAVRWTALSAFSNAGQRCAAASRVAVFGRVYERFRSSLLARTAGLRVGPGDADDLGPVINRKQLDGMLASVREAVARGATLAAGGHRLTGPEHASGFFMAPTLLEGVAPDDPISRVELFGPIACLYRVDGFEEGVAIANDSPYGLTACIHTRSLDRAMSFVQRAQAGVVVVNGGTHGSEPHMPFGGVKASGNGWREPGTEALEVYTETKDVYIHTVPARATERLAS
jgi:aldehyde dehydrogenase (NAD+)